MFPDLTRDDVFRLETGRLWLRWPRRGDAEAIGRLAGDKAVADMTAAIPHPYPGDAAAGYVARRRLANGAGRSLSLAMTARADPLTPIGMVSIVPASKDGRPYLSFWLGRAHWGEGFATEGARALIDAFFGYSDGAELTSAARLVNPAARRVLEKCGFAFAGATLMPCPARGGVFPADEFRLDRRAWASLKSWSRLGYVPERRHAGSPGAEREALGA